MHSWFTQKLNGLIGLAYYCQYPIIGIHLILTRKAVDEAYGIKTSEDTAMERALALMISQAKIDGQDKAARHLEKALKSLGQNPTEETDNVVEYDFSAPKVQRSRSGR